jgi:hypothetical protein
MYLGHTSGHSEPAEFGIPATVIIINLTPELNQETPPKIKEHQNLAVDTLLPEVSHILVRLSLSLTPALHRSRSISYTVAGLEPNLRSVWLGYERSLSVTRFATKTS